MYSFIFGVLFVQNILIFSSYYSRISIQRAAALLNVSTDEIEKRVSDLVNDRIMYARIDR